MRKTRRCGRFFFRLCVNMLLNWKGLIPAAILFALRTWIRISLWWPLLAAGAWAVYLILRTAVIRWAVKCGSASSPHQENKNPYSNTGNTNKYRSISANKQ